MTKRHILGIAAAILVLIGSTAAMVNFWNARDYGLEISNVRLTAAGYMLDLRYKISNPERALKVLNKKVKPYIIDEKSGAKLQVPAPTKVGPLRQLAVNPSVKKNYFMIFANPGRRLQRGDKISLVLGDFRAQHLIIQ